MNNPPAFPPNAGWRDNDPDCRGMTLRDYFAAKAMQCFGQSSIIAAGSYEVVAKIAFKIADAMLKARKQ